MPEERRGMLCQFTVPAYVISTFCFDYVISTCMYSISLPLLPDLCSLYPVFVFAYAVRHPLKHVYPVRV